MLRLLMRHRTAVVVLTVLHVMLLCYFSSNYYRLDVIHKYVVRSEETSVQLDEDHQDLKYSSLPSSQYGDIWRLPLKPFRVPPETESMDDASCAEVFGARYTTYCEQTSTWMVRNMKLSSNASSLTLTSNDSITKSAEDLLLEYCPCFPPTLIGRQNVSGIIHEHNDTHSSESPTKEESKSHWMDEVESGGRWAPKNCRARQRVAIIIPFRDRQSHLNKLLQRLHPMLQRQQIDYTIFVVEQNEPTHIFNKGMLMNTGFINIHGEHGIRRDVPTRAFVQSNKTSNTYLTTPHAKGKHTSTQRGDKKQTESSSKLKQTPSAKTSDDIVPDQTAHIPRVTPANHNQDNYSEKVLQSSGGMTSQTLGPEFWGSFDCYIFHDVDMLPEDDRNIYTCTKTPRHIGVFVSKFNYTRCCGAIFGGATSFTAQQFITLNGYSNEYYGWGGEDDDILFRLRWRNIPFVHYPRCVSRYTMIQHERDHRNTENPNRVIAVKFRPDVYKQVGLSSLRYNLVKSELRPLYTWLLIDLPPTVQLPDGTVIPRFERTKDGRIIRVA